MMNSIQFIGYHGTKSDCAKNICQEKKFRPSHKSSEWLGKGIYFFKDDIIQAAIFAKYRHLENISVLSIDIETDNYIDMAITEDRNAVDLYLKKVLKCYKEKDGVEYKNLVDTHPELKRGLKDNSSEGIILDLMYEIEPYDLVICPFEVPGKKKHKLFRSKATHIQVCVKDDSCIDYDSLRKVDNNELEKILP